MEFNVNISEEEVIEHIIEMPEDDIVNFMLKVEKEFQSLELLEKITKAFIKNYVEAIQGLKSEVDYADWSSDFVEFMETKIKELDNPK